MIPELQRLDAETVIWSAYDPQVKAELFSTAIATDAGIYIVDPIRIGEEQIRAVAGDSAVAGVVLTNANHVRAAAEVAQLCSARIYAHRDVDEAWGTAEPAELRCGENSPPGLTSIRIEGAAPGEVALHCARGGGTLIIGDALINFGSHGFDFLPAKYCTDHKRMRRELQRLLDFEFERLLFAHGEPITTRAKQRLEALLSDG